MKHRTGWIVAVCFPLLVAAQSWEAIKMDTKNYLYGEGFAETVEEADISALEDLISKISVSVSSNTKSQLREKNSNGELDDQSIFEKCMNTYSEATLTNTMKLIIHNEPDAHVGRYIKRSEIDKIFEGRKRKVFEYVRLAIAAEKKNKLDDALRNYYWALTLLKTVQYASDVVYEDSEGHSHTLLTWIPQQMDDIFDDIQLKVYAKDGANLTLYFSYNDKPVTSIDYTYYDGKDWSNIYSCANGLGVLELPKDIDVERVQLKFEYAYRGQSHIDRELESVMKMVRSKAMRACYKTMDIKPVVAAPEEPMVDLMASAKAYVSAGIDNMEQDLYTKIMNAIVEGIRTRNYSSLDKYFTPYGKDVFKKLIQYGNARVLNVPAYEMMHFDGNTIVRSVPMSFSFANGSRKAFVENVVFTFDASGKVDNVAFGLDNVAYMDIMSKSVWSERARQTIVNFMENYKTAFALERLDYISDIFADDAIIIVGKTVHRMENTGDLGPKMNKYIQRTQMTKQQYMKNLQAVFDNNEFVNIRFGNTMVTKAGAGRGELYGIQLKQDYYSSHYGDSGYLYLQVELDDPDRPLIRIRTWQEEPDPEVGRPYGMEDF